MTTLMVFQPLKQALLGHSTVPNRPKAVVDKPKEKPTKSGFGRKELVLSVAAID